MNYLKKKRPGDSVTFEVERDGKKKKVELRLGRPRNDE